MVPKLGADHRARMVGMSLLRLDQTAYLVYLADPPSQVPRTTEKKRMKLRITHSPVCWRSRL